jgi:hypothetical protein
MRVRRADCRSHEKIRNASLFGRENLEENNLEALGVDKRIICSFTKKLGGMVWIGFNKLKVRSST